MIRDHLCTPVNISVVEVSVVGECLFGLQCSGGLFFVSQLLCLEMSTQCNFDIDLRFNVQNILFWSRCSNACVKPLLVIFPARDVIKLAIRVLLSLVAVPCCLQGRAYDEHPKFPEPLIFAPFAACTLRTYGAVVGLRRTGSKSF